MSPKEAASRFKEKAISYNKHALLAFEREARAIGFKSIAGVDEAGRGPLAGPVVAAACILPENFFHPKLDDSKKLTPAIRDALFPLLTAFPHGIGIVSHEEIDRINILQATHKAMHLALSALPVKPDYILVDGLQLTHEIPSRKIIDGDALSHSIAAASVIAKVTRDRIMLQLDVLYPHFGFRENKGYGTAKHLKAIEQFGLSPYHRKSFRTGLNAPDPAQLSFSLHA
ncbi:MAG: ribonuclease HII [Parachlamydiaceae bacterium]